MSTLADPRRPSRQALRARREAIEARLAVAGLRARRGPRPLEAARAGEPPALRLAEALRALGPVMAAFGRYLARRPDLLDRGDANFLEAAGVPAPPLPPAELEALLSAAWQRPSGEVLAALEPVPERSGLLAHRYRGRLIDGREVAVQVSDPRVPAAVLLDVPLLDHLAGLLAAGDLALELGRADLEDFSRHLASRLDSRQQAEALGALRAEVGEHADLAPPAAVAELSRNGILVVERAPGVPLAELAPTADPSSGTALRAVLTGTPRAAELGGRLCAAWLSLALRTGQVAVDLDPGRVMVLESDGDRPLWQGGECAALPAGAQRHLWDYLMAAAGQDPDRAADALLAEMVAGAHADPDALRTRMRQAVPFRDSAPGAGEDLASYLFLHWRLAREAGFEPKAHLLPFQRGLTALTATVRPLDGVGGTGHDALREGVERCQLRAGLGDLGRLIDPRHMGRSAEQALSLMIDLPERLDHLLTMLSEDRLAIRLETHEPPEARARRHASSAALGLLLAMAAVAVVAHSLAAAGGFGIWGERFATVLLAVLGLHLLRILGRSR